MEKANQRRHTAAITKRAINEIQQQYFSYVPEGKGLANHYEHKQDIEQKCMKLVDGGQALSIQGEEVELIELTTLYLSLALDMSRMLDMDFARLLALTLTVTDKVFQRVESMNREDSENG